MEASRKLKKTFAYATLAAVLGIAVMLAPFVIIPVLVPNFQKNEAGYTDRSSAPLPQSLAPANTQAVARQSESSTGVVPNYPVDALTVVLMLLFSLALAVSAYFYVRRNRFLRSVNMPLQP